ncbi:MAG: carbohydrate ABC transporter permease [Saccharofermentans sp.]|nr:carbohydrate ABC transporter permease [Saccharofermentans sp.]
MAGSKRKKMAKGDVVFNAVIYTFFALFVLITLYPVINILAYSFNNYLDSFRGHIHLIPRKFDLHNYVDALQLTGIRRGLLTSFARTVAGTITSLAANALLAFILSRKKFPFRRAFSLFWIMTIYVQGGIIPTYILYSKLYMRETFWVYIIPGMINALYVLVIRTYMKSIPDSLEESAKIEGAGYGKIFTSVVSPLCKPVYAAVGLFIATGHWNSWFDVLLYNRHTPELTTLQYELFKLNLVLRHNVNDVKGSFSGPPRSVKCAAAVLTMLPLFIAYPFFQKYFIDGLKVGTIKD